MFEIALKKIKCIIKDSFAADSDEPYVIAFAVDLATAGLLPLGSSKTTLYGPWEGDKSMDGGDEHIVKSGELLWGFDNQPRDIANSEDALILVGLMESDHDAAGANSLRTLFNTAMFGSLATYSIPDMDRTALAEALRKDMQGHLDVLRKLIGPPENDERLGKVREVRISPETLNDAQNGVVTLPPIKFTNSVKDFEYDLTFQIGMGVGSVSQGLGSDADAVDPTIDRHRPAAVVGFRGNNLDIITLPIGSTSAVRISSSNAGQRWSADAESYQIGQGVFTSGSAAAVSGDGKSLHAFGRGNDHRCWRAFSPNGGANWTLAWAPIGQGVFTSSLAAAVSTNGKQLHVFGRGNDNRFWRAFSPDGGANWTLAWAPIGDGVFTSAPAAAMSSDGKQLHVFGRGNDNRFWRAFSPDGGANWTLAWAPIGVGVFTSAPAAVVSADGKQLHVFGRGNDKRFWRAFSTDGGTTWSVAWEPIGQGVFSSGPSAAISADGRRVHVFGRGINPAPPPPGTFPDPEEPRIWRAFSSDGASHWNLAWSPIKPDWINVPEPH